MEILLLSITLLLIGSITAHYANKRGRNPMYWFMAGALLGIMGLLLLFLLPNLAIEKSKEGKDIPVISNPNDFSQPNTISEYQRKKWFYMDDTHTQQGPVSFEQLMPAWQNEVISRDSFVWSEGMTEWKTIQELPQFEEAIFKDAKASSQ